MYVGMYIHVVTWQIDTLRGQHSIPDYHVTKYTTLCTHAHMFALLSNNPLALLLNLKNTCTYVC